MSSRVRRGHRSTRSIAELVGAVPEVRDAALSAADSLLEVARGLIAAAERAAGASSTGTPSSGDAPVGDAGAPPT